MVGIAQRVQGADADGFGEIESSIHGAIGIGGEHDVGGVQLDSDGVGLRRGGARRRHAELRGDAGGVGAGGEDEACRRGIGGEAFERAFGQCDAAIGEGAVDLAGGELNLRHGGLTAEGGGARLGVEADGE